MPLSEQEQRCVELACSYLSKIHGGEWKILEGPTIDEQYPSESSPEVIVSNGKARAAVEVKRLTGDSMLQAYFESLGSLNRYLVPSCGGYYHLNPSAGLKLPIDRWLRNLLKKEIERIAPLMNVGDEAGVRIPRQADLRMFSPSGPGQINCWHTHTGHVVMSLSNRLTGVFFLDDEHPWEHSFLTEEAREDFFRAIEAGCQKLREGGSGHVKWYEEWELTRVKANRDGVWILAVHMADVRDSVRQNVESMLEKALPKFESQRWADSHVIVFENCHTFADPDLVSEAICGFDADELDVIDLILLVDGSEVSAVWSRPTQPEPALL